MGSADGLGCGHSSRPPRPEMADGTMKYLFYHCQQLLEDSFLRVQAILRLLPDHGLRSFEDRLGDLFAAMGGQTMQDHGAGRRALEQGVVDDVAGERARAGALLVLLAHRRPYVGVDHMSAARRLAGR